MTDSANHFSVKLSLFMCMLAACSGSLVHYMHVSVFHLLPDVYSLEWDEVQWRDIGDDGAIALTDPRVFKNFKTLK